LLLKIRSHAFEQLHDRKDLFDEESQLLAEKVQDFFDWVVEKAVVSSTLRLKNGLRLTRGTWDELCEDSDWVPLTIETAELLAEPGLEPDDRRHHLVTRDHPIEWWLLVAAYVEIKMEETIWNDM
jgi:hypothetical protein